MTTDLSACRTRDGIWNVVTIRICSMTGGLPCTRKDKETYMKFQPTCNAHILYWHNYRKSLSWPCTNSASGIMEILHVLGKNTSNFSLTGQTINHRGICPATLERLHTSFQKSLVLVWESALRFSLLMWSYCLLSLRTSYLYLFLALFLIWNNTLDVGQPHSRRIWCRNLADLLRCALYQVPARDSSCYTIGIWKSAGSCL